MSITRSFTNTYLEGAWQDAWVSGILHNTDFKWYIREHSFENNHTRILQTASLSKMQNILGNNLTDNSASIFESFYKEKQTTNRKDQHLFWGQVLGYPPSQVELYADPEMWQKRISFPFFPETFAPAINGAYSVFDLHHPEVLEFQKRIHATVAHFEKLKKQGHSLIDIFNNWDFYP